MIELGEKTNLSNEQYGHSHYFDVEQLQKRFKLLARGKDFAPTLFSFLYEAALLGYFCLSNKRFRQIASVIFKLVRQIAKSRRCGERDSAKMARWLLDAFVELGPTFIKIGQFLSSRGDLLPEEYVSELSKLQDSCLPLPFEEVELLIEKELRKPQGSIFKTIEKEPIASASIGQVHKAVLLNGSEVVIKIQRPDLNILFYQDLAILRCLAMFFERYTKTGKDREWVGMVDEIGKTLFEEIDFIQEGRNADHFRQNLKHEERIYIPKIFWQHTTRKLITIEFVSGIKITDIGSLVQNNLDPKELALVLVNAYFKQFFEDGFYHADPHPGNIVVKNDGTIVFYDFGMVGRINEGIRAELANVLVSVIGNDTETLLDTLKKLKLIKPGVDTQPIKRVIEQAAYKYYDGEKLGALNLSELDEDLEKLFKEKPMRLPSSFTYTLRATGELEGICRTLDPDFSLVKAAVPYFQEWILASANGGSPKSKWLYLKAMFPKQSKLIDKVKVYLEVLKDLPKYVSDVEQSKNRLSTNPKEEIDRASTLAEKENEELKAEIRETNLKLNFAYSVIFLLCFVFIGSFLVERGSYITGTLGFVLLVCSLAGSIGIVSWMIVKRKVIE